MRLGEVHYLRGAARTADTFQRQIQSQCCACRPNIVPPLSSASVRPYAGTLVGLPGCKPPRSQRPMAFMLASQSCAEHFSPRQSYADYAPVPPADRAWWGERCAVAPAGLSPLSCQRVRHRHRCQGPGHAPLCAGESLGALLRGRIQQGEYPAGSTGARVVGGALLTDLTTTVPSACFSGVLIRGGCLMAPEAQSSAAFYNPLFLPRTLNPVACRAP